MMLRLLRRFLLRPHIRTLSSLEAYRHWAANYPPHAHNPLMQAEEATMRRLLPDLRGKFVLDLACGTGRYGKLAQEKGASDVIGNDNSMAMLAANPLSQRALASTEAIPLGTATVDVILCGLALGHLPQLPPTMHEISRVLKPGGLALVSDIHPIVALNGGQRTFTDGSGETYAVEHYPHLYADYHRAAKSAGMQIADVIETTVEGAESPVPAVIVYALEKSN